MWSWQRGPCRCVVGEVGDVGDPWGAALAENKLRLRAPDGVFEDSWEERSRRYPLQRGERVELSELTITVLEVTPDGRPSVCDFEFGSPLESPAYRWLTWRHERLEPLALPKVGERRQL